MCPWEHLLSPQTTFGVPNLRFGTKGSSFPFPTISITAIVYEFFLFLPTPGKHTKPAPSRAHLEMRVPQNRRPLLWAERRKINVARRLKQFALAVCLGGSRGELVSCGHHILQQNASHCSTFNKTPRRKKNSQGEISNVQKNKRCSLCALAAAHFTGPCIPVIRDACWRSALR